MAETILIVDDNAANLKLSRVLLAAAGYTVITASDAEQALLVLEQTVPRLILMDIQLPGMDGLTLTRLLKARSDTREVTIVAFTAFAMKGDEEKAFAAGCDGYITKPVDTRAFSMQVAAILNQPAKL